MTKNNQIIRFYRKHIPALECVSGCHDCCGPVTATSEEVAKLPIKTAAEHKTALAHFSCPYLGKKGCEVYGDRPLICRLFGTTPNLPCPNGKKPVEMVNPKIEQKIHQFLAETRQVLL
ncbi:MAG: YkgJ family cysteine cluster protein [Methylophilus sp.]